MSENCWGLKKDERPQSERARGVPNKISVINPHLGALWKNLKSHRKGRNSKLLKKETITHEEASVYLIGIQPVLNNDRRDKKTGMHYFQSAKELQTRSMSRKRMK